MQKIPWITIYEVSNEPWKGFCLKEMLSKQIMATSNMASLSSSKELVYIQNFYHNISYLNYMHVLSQHLLPSDL